MRRTASASLAPEVFELDDDDQLHYDPQPAAALREKVEQAVRAVRGCPVQAIRLVEE